MGLKEKNNSSNTNSISKNNSGSLPLSLVLVVSFVLQIFAAVGITGYLSFRNGQKAVHDLATDLLK